MDFKQKFEEISNTPDYTSEMDQNDIESNKPITLLAYLSWLLLIPLFVKKESKFARFHCNQGIALAIAELAASLIMGILGGVPVLGVIVSILGAIVWIICVAYFVLGLLNVLNGKAKELPFIGKFRILK